MRIGRFSRTVLTILGFLLFSFSGSAAAPGLAWTNISGGSWSVAANWSSNVAPDATFSVIAITNTGSKVVTVDSTTPVANLSIQKLTLASADGGETTLRLDNAGTNQPLRLSSTLTVSRGANLELNNSALVINGASGGILNLMSGNLRVNNGFYDNSTTTAGKIGNTNNGLGTMTLDGGTMLFGQLQVAPISGSRGTLTVSNGLFHAKSLLTIAQAVNSTGIVHVAGGEFIATNDLTRVGNLGTARLEISGGLANFAFLTAGENEGSEGSINLAGGELRITPRSTNDLLRIGSMGNGRLEVSAGRHWVLSEFHLADWPTSTGIVSVVGGELIATNDLTAIGRYGYGEMTITNASVILTNASVGRHNGSIGVLTTLTNGVISQLGDLSIARFSNSVGHVYLRGGEMKMDKDTVWVGREGTGDLTVSSGILSAKELFVAVAQFPTNFPVGTVDLSGGTIALSSALLVGTELTSTGHVAISGGALLVGDSNSGRVKVDAGSLSLSGGTARIYELTLTNPAGQFTFSSGLLQVATIACSNGAPFVVGDGTQPATLELRGGTSVFANGLVISPNATLKGCGTILGEIINQGTISTNCGPSGPVITLTKRDGSTNTIYFKSLSGPMHTLEYKQDLQVGPWTPILPGIPGDGNVLSLIDTNAVGPNRFYRISAQ